MVEELLVDPKIFWKRLKPLKHGDNVLQVDALMAYVRELYHVHGFEDKMTEETCDRDDMLSVTLEDVQDGLKRLVNGKAAYACGLKAEKLKWAGEEVTNKLVDMFNISLRDGFPRSWQVNQGCATA